MKIKEKTLQTATPVSPVCPVALSKDHMNRHIVKQPDWDLVLDGCSVRFELIGGDILHAVSSGYLASNHIAPIAAMREKVLHATDPSRGFDFIVVNVKDMTGSSRKARQLYMNSYQEWHHFHPFRMFILYGVNRFFHAASFLARPFMPFKIRVARDLDEALEIIARENLEEARPKSAVKSRDHIGKFQASDPQQQYVDELLTYLGSINWEHDGIKEQKKIDPLHPYFPVFEAIGLVKRELDDLFQERRRAAEALRESEERYRTILESIEDGYYEFDLAGNFIFGNNSISRILGYRQEELVGLNNRKYMSKEQAAIAYQVFNRVYRTGNPDAGFDWEFIRKDGTRRYVEGSISLMKDRKGQPTGFRGVLRDITKRKDAEKTMLRARDELEKRVEERTWNLAQVNEKLKKEISERKAAQAEALQAKEVAEAANYIKSEFLANMSHELRTPLNHIIGFTELVLDEDFGELNEVQSEYLSEVVQSSRHLLSLINDILDLSKVEAGKQELHFEEIHVKGLLENSFTIIREMALKHGIELLSELENVPEYIQADERKLKQIIYNLLSNAVKFTPDGGRVLLSAKVVECMVRPGTRQGDHAKFLMVVDRPKVTGRVDEMQGKCLEVSLADTGIGIKIEDLDRIFNPFEQVDGSSRRRYQGTGLGLALTKGLVQLHGGKIWVESEGENKGSTFRFLIPIQGSR